MDGAILELLSAFAALAAIIFAVVEALIKFQGKKSEKAIIFYSKYLYICQQIELGVLSINLLLKNYSNLSAQEKMGYAKAHMLNNDIIQCTYDFEELSFVCFYSKDKGQCRLKVKRALDFGACAVSLVEMINSFYQSIILISKSNSQTEENAELDKLQEMNNQINVELNKLNDSEIIPSNNSVLERDEGKFSDIMRATANQHQKPERWLHKIFFIVCIGIGILSFGCIVYGVFGIIKNNYLHR